MNDELRKVIQLENSLLSLSERRKEKGQEVEDTKDLMRKIRENVYKPAHSLYCFSHGVAVKRRLNELYPFMEKQLK